MPPKGKTKSSISNPYNLHLKPILDITSEDIDSIIEKDVTIFRKSFPSSNLSNKADNLLGLLEILDTYKSSILATTHLAPRDKIVKSRNSLNKVFEQHPTSIILQSIAKKEINPSVYISKITQLKPFLEILASNLPHEKVYSEITAALNSASELSREISRVYNCLKSSDRQIQSNYEEYFHTKKALLKQFKQPIVSRILMRCNSIWAKIKDLSHNYQVFSKIVPSNKSKMRDEGTAYFKKMEEILLDYKTASIPAEILRKIDSVLSSKQTKSEAVKNSKASSTDDYEEEEDDEEEDEEEDDYYEEEDDEEKSSSRSSSVQKNRTQATQKPHPEETQNSNEVKTIYSTVEELTKPLMMIDSDGRVQYEFPFLVSYPLQQLYDLSTPTESDLILAFTNSVKVYKDELMKFDQHFFSLKFFYNAHKIILYLYQNKIDKVEEFQSTISKIPEKILKYQHLAAIEKFIITGIESIQSHPQKWGNHPNLLLNWFGELFALITPVICIVKTFEPFNNYMKQNSSIKGINQLSLLFDNFMNKHSAAFTEIQFKPYAYIQMDRLAANPKFDEFISSFIDEIQSDGNPLIDDSDHMICSKIFIPRISELLIKIQKKSLKVLEKIENSRLNEFVSNFLNRPYDIVQIAEFQQNLYQIKKSEIEQKTLNSLLRYVETLYSIHFLLVLLHFRGMNTYSNLLNYTYARFFVKQLTLTDFLTEHYISAPFSPTTCNTIVTLLRKRTTKAVDSKLHNTHLVRMKSFDYFPSENFCKLFVLNIDQNLMDQLPPELNEIIQLAVADAPENTETNIDRKFKIDLIQAVLGSKNENHVNNLINVIESISDLYLSLLDITINQEKIIIAPPVIRTILLKQRTATDDFPEKLRNPSFFFEFFKVINSTIQINITQILDNIINLIVETNVPQITPADVYEKYKGLISLSMMKRGFLSSSFAIQFARSIFSEKFEINAAFLKNAELLKEVCKLFKILLLLDMHDFICHSTESLRNASILRNINLGLFCKSLNKRLLFLNTAGEIDFINKDKKRIMAELVNMDTFGQFILSHLSEVDNQHCNKIITFLTEIAPSLKSLSDQISLENVYQLFITDENQYNQLLLKLNQTNAGIEIANFLNFANTSSQRHMSISTQFCALSSTEIDAKLYLLINTDLSNLSDTSDSFLKILKSEKESEAERLAKIESLIEKHEQQYLLAEDTFITPIPNEVVSLSQQELMAQYLQKLKDERDSLIPKELKNQEYYHEYQNLKEIIESQQNEKHALYEEFQSIRMRLRELQKKDQQKQKSKSKTKAKGRPTDQNIVSTIDNMMNKFEVQPNGQLAFDVTENEDILNAVCSNSMLLVQRFQADIRLFEQRNKQCLELNHTLKASIDQLEQSSNDMSKTVKKLENQSNAIHNLVTGSSSLHETPDVNSPLDEFVKKTLVDLNLATNATLEEIEDAKKSIRDLQDNLGDTAVDYIISQRLDELQNDNDMPAEDRDRIRDILLDIKSLLENILQ